MNHLTLVTGNKNKLLEWQSLVPEDIKLKMADIDLEEIQTDDASLVVISKAKKAYEILKTPVVVEDVSAGLEKLMDLPGPFIKFFIKKLGRDALWELADHNVQRGYTCCSIAYYDGQNMRCFTARVDGRIVEPKGSNGFGFDRCFMPEGQAKTYAEMSHLQKAKASHRALAIQKLVEHLRQENSK